MAIRAIAWMAVAAFAGVLSGNPPAEGAAAFEKRCGGCHGTDQARVGPALRGAYGRRAGRVPGFPYSKALKTAGVVWNEGTLEKWLTDPDSLIPGNDMALRLTSGAERAAIIAYLKQLK